MRMNGTEMNPVNTAVIRAYDDCKPPDRGVAIAMT